jgi:outer membrane protein
MKVRIIIILIASIGFCKAQNRVITFEEAVKIALKNGVQLNQQRNNLENSQMQKTSAWLGFGPTLSANSSFNQVNGNFFNQNEGKVVNGIFNQLSGSINAGINIFSGFNQVNRVKQFNHELDAQLHFVERTQQDLLNTVATQYLQVLLDQELLRIANENWEALKKQLEQVTEQVKVGARSPVEEYNQDSQTKAAEIRALQAEINLINDKALLTQTLLLDPVEVYDVAKPLWDINIIGQNELEIQNALQTALKSRGDYLRAEQNEISSKYAMKASRGNMIPSLFGFWNMNTFYNKLDGDNTAAAFDQQVKTDNLRKVYGVQLSIPILGGNSIFQNRSAYVQQRTTFYNNQIIRKNVEVQVKADVIRAHQNFKLVKRTFTVSLAQLQAAETAFSLETERYNLGVTNFVDFINANRVFVQAQTDKAQAEYRLLFQKVLLDYAVGTLKVEDIQP